MRIAPAIFTVTTTANSGLGSLRQAILDANASPGLDHIQFSIGSGTYATINTLTELPTISDAVDIDGSTQPGTADWPQIVIYGSKTQPHGTNGLVLSGHGADGSTINGLTFLGFTGNGLLISNSDQNHVTASTFGTSYLGGIVENDGTGISLVNANHNTLGGSSPGAGLIVSAVNYLSRSLAAVHFEASSDNQILGSKIGGSYGDGIVINSSSGNIIGAPGAGNVISGNQGYGIHLSLCSGTLIQANIIGLAADGITKAGNDFAGIFMENSPGQAAANKMGGANAGEGNIISGNSGAGISIGSAGSVIIQGNRIGTDLHGNVVPSTAAPGYPPNGTGNVGGGISARLVSDLLIGGDTAGAQNVISGNGTMHPGALDLQNQVGGIYLSRSTAVVTGNLIGTDGTGTVAAGNLYDGIAVDGGSVVIGGSTAAARNIISANGLASKTITAGYGSGINLTNNATATILGNYIGTDITGTKDLGNAFDGIRVESTYGRGPLTIGGLNPADGNVISGNGGYGVQIGAQVNGSLGAVINPSLGNNYIGTNAQGTGAIGNDAGGIDLTARSSSVRIGQIYDGKVVTSGARNVISGNGGSGILMEGNQGTIDGNYIGVDASGLKALGNNLHGVEATTAARSSTFQNNVISANGFGASDGHGAGLVVAGDSPRITGNIIGLSADLATPLGNAGDGVQLHDITSKTIMGFGSAPGNNTIAANGGDGIEVNEQQASLVSIVGNKIGFGTTTTFQNKGDGIHVVAGAASIITVSNNTISNNRNAGIEVGPGAGAGITKNYLYGQGSTGIALHQALSSTVIQGNIIGLMADGVTAAPNLEAGIFVDRSSVEIGGRTESQRNVISGNAGDGIYLEGDCTGTIIHGNFIGTDQNGSVVPKTSTSNGTGNGAHGILAENAFGVIIGDDVTAAGRNVISGNGTNGANAKTNVRHYGGIVLSNSRSITVQRNYIGTDATGAVAAGNYDNGLWIGGNSEVLIGGSDAGDGNVISGNSGPGISAINGSASIVGNYIGVDATGMAALGNKGSGISVSTSATISGNVISGNVSSGSDAGVSMSGTSYVTLTSNIIGLNAQKTGALGNSGPGILVSGGGGGLIVGTPGNGNTIGGNSGNGITLGVVGKYSVTDNFIGTTGTAAFPNHGYGIHAAAGALNVENNRIGNNAYDGVEVTNTGVADVVGNVIFNNGWYGVDVSNGARATILGNTVGLNPEGAAAGNQIGGISIVLATAAIGGSNPGDGNGIAANKGNGITLSSALAGTTIQGNAIGMATAAGGDLGNRGMGIRVFDSPGILIGGPTTAARNVISWNDDAGILVQGASTGTLIQGNYIGTNATGSLNPALPTSGNGTQGIGLSGTDSVTVDGNVISGNGFGKEGAHSFNYFGGLVLEGTSHTQITGNFIGTDAMGSAAIPNRDSGVRLIGGSDTVIGGDTSAARNVISGNGLLETFFDGAGIVTSSASGVVIAGNYIGTDATGTKALGNLGPGILIAGAGSGPQKAVLVGGATEAAGNVISGNGAPGIVIGEGERHLSVQTGNVEIGHNKIGTDADGSHPLGNATAGVLLATASSDVLVGEVTVNGALVPAGNLISGNDGAGLMVRGHDETIAYNYIGVNATGDQPLGNARDGVVLGGEIMAQFITVKDNVISANGPGTSGNFGFSGISIFGADVTLTGNTIGLDAARLHPLGNGGPGITFRGNSERIQIGTLAPDAGNVIGANGGNGIDVRDSQQLDLTIAGDFIGVFSGVAFANAGDGIHLEGVADPAGHESVIGNTIGHNSGNGLYLGMFSAATVQDNEISGNTLSGVQGQSLALATLTGNKIHDNRQNGVTVGTLATLQQNAIYGNGGLAIDLGADGPTPNDPLDVDEGANHLQNTADFRSAYLRYGSTLIRGSFDGAPSRDLRVEFFANEVDAEGHEIGSTFLREITLHTDAAGHANFSIDELPVAPGTRIASTVTDLETKTTSEFSSITAALPPSLFAVGTERGAVGTAALVAVDGSGGHTPLSVQPYGAKFKTGVNVAHADVDHDGLDDLITAPAAGIQPVRVFSGFDGAPLASWDAAPARFTGGVTVAAGDVDGDGVADIITALGQGGAPWVTVHEALSGLAKNSFLAFAAATRTGVNLTTGDLDGDGRVEVVTSTASGRAAVHVFQGNGTSASPVIRPFSTTFSAGAHVAVYHPGAGADALLAIGSGAGVKSTVAFYQADGSMALPAIRVGDPKANAEVHLATAPSEDGSFDYLVTGTDASAVLEIRAATTATPMTFRPFDLPARLGLTLG